MKTGRPGQDKAGPAKTGAPGSGQGGTGEDGRARGQDKTGPAKTGARPENSCWPEPTSKTAYRARFATGAIHLAPTERGWTTSSTRASPHAVPVPTAAPATVSLK